MVEVVVAGKINCQKLSSIIIMYSKSKLSNGATVITVPVKGTEAATVLTLFPVGSRYEKEKQSGLSHFIEHMMFKGTLKRPSTLDISQELDKVGAEYNAYTSRDYTGYYVKASFEHLDLSLDLLSDMLWGSQFKEEELEKEKGVIVEELNMYKDNPTMYAEQLFEETLYANHPLGRDVGGLEKTVRQMTRKEMVGYYESFYQPQNMILVVAGRIDSHLKSKVIKFFGSNHHKSSKPIFKIYKQPEKTPVRLKSFYKKTDQAHLALGFPSFSYDNSKNPALAILNVVLGGTMSSRLFVEVREKRGLAYMINSGLNRYYETGNLVVRAGLDKNRVAEAAEIILNEFEKIKEKGVTKEELSMAKENLAGRMVLALEDSSAQAEWYGKQALLMKKIRTPLEEIKRLRAVTLKEVQAVAKEVFQNKFLRVAAIGPYATAGDLAEALKIK